LVKIKKGADIMQKILRFTPLLMLISCANVQSTTVEHQHGQIHQITCSEFNTTLQECKAKANELCGNDFKLLSHHKEVFPDAHDGFYIHPRHYLSVECTS
jgi:hypothetical protein